MKNVHLAIAPTLVVLAIALFSSAQASAQAPATIGNGIYEAHVQIQAAGTQAGSWNAITGPGHPAGGDRDILFRAQNPTTNFSSLRIYHSATSFADFTPGARGGAGDLDDHFESEGPSPLAASGQGWRTVWHIPAEGLRITQDVLVVGDDVDDSAVYHTVDIRNVGAQTTRIGWRNLHDWSLTGASTGFQDSPTNELESACSTSLFGPTRDEFSHSPVSAGLVRMALASEGGDYSPVLSLGFDPGFVPFLPVTVPDEYAYVDWRRAFDTAFDDTIQNLTDLDDSAGISWFGRTASTGLNVLPAQSVRFTQVLFAFEDEGCPPPPTCADVPRGLVGWWPFDEEDQGSGGGRFADVARGHDGIARFPPSSIDGKVGRAADFDGSNDEIVVPDHPDLDIRAGEDLSIDFWMRTTLYGNYILVEKRGVSPLRGYVIFQFGDEVGIQLADGSGGQGFRNFVADASITDGEWHFIAVTVDRDNPAGLIWYVDGEVVSIFDPTGHPGSLENDAPLTIGAGNPDAPFAFSPYPGQLDELEIARRVFSPGEIEDIYEAGSLGKCAASLDVRWDTQLCLGQSSVSTQLTVCNGGARDERFVFDFAGLPPNPPGVPHGHKCKAQGPSGFSLLGNPPLAVPAGQCRTARVQLSGISNQLDEQAACFEVTATDLVSGLQKTDHGSVTTVQSLCCAPLEPVTAINPGGDGSGTVVFEIEDTGVGTSEVTLLVEPFQTDEDAPPALSLADAAPGEGIERTVSFGADGTATLEVPVRLTEDFTPRTFYDVLLSGDFDGDSEPDPLTSASIMASPDPCIEGLNGLCLNQERFRVQARWRTDKGESGLSQAVPLTTDTGFFWFFDDANLELVVKVLDACAIYDRFWVFAGGLTDVEVEIVVTDLVTGATKEYGSGLGTPFQPIQDTDAFDGCDLGPEGSSAALAAALATQPKVAELPLNDERFVVEVDWETNAGESGRGEGIRLTSDTGYFWFFGEDNVELVVKVLDACGISDRFWVFAAGLTDVGVRLRVTDTSTGQTKVYENTLGTAFEPILDTGTFSGCT